MLVIGVGNDLHAANRNVSHMGHHFYRIRILSSADKDNRSTKSGDDACASQIFRKLAAWYLIVVGI